MARAGIEPATPRFSVLLRYVRAGYEWRSLAKKPLQIRQEWVKDDARSVSGFLALVDLW